MADDSPASTSPSSPRNSTQILVWRAALSWAETPSLAGEVTSSSSLEAALIGFSSSAHLIAIHQDLQDRHGTQSAWWDVRRQQWGLPGKNLNFFFHPQ